MHNLPGKAAAQALEAERVEREEAIKAAYEPATQKKLLTYARRRCDMLERRGCPVHIAQPEDLVQDAIVDTWLGEIAWTPPFPIVSHLMGAIRGRTARLLEQQLARPHTSEHDAAFTPSPDADLIRNEVVLEVIQYVTANAGADHDVRELLDRYLRDNGDRGEVMEDGMFARNYDNARRRLDRIIARAPADLRAAVDLCLSRTL